MSKTFAFAHIRRLPQNCLKCHHAATTNWNVYLRDPERRVLADWVTRLHSDNAGQRGDSAAGRPTDEVQTADRERRLTQLRDEIEAINQELAKLREEVELEQQRAGRREELDKLRGLLEQLRKNPEGGDAPQQQKQ